MSERVEDCTETSNGKCKVKVLVNAQEISIKKLIGLVNGQSQDEEEVMADSRWNWKIYELRASEVYRRREFEINKLISSQENIQRTTDDIACSKYPYTSQAYKDISFKNNPINAGYIVLSNDLH